MPAPLPSPQGFRLHSYLESGPFGHVYRACDERNPRDVAIKLLDPRRCTSSGLARLAATADRAASSWSARDERFYEFVADPLRPIVVMNLLPGANLQNLLLAAGPPPWQLGRRLGHAVATALEASRRGRHPRRGQTDQHPLDRSAPPSPTRAPGLLRDPGPSPHLHPRTRPAPLLAAAAFVAALAGGLAVTCL